MVGGMFSASALYPLEVLKTRMQAETKGSGKKEEKEGELLLWCRGACA